MEDGQIEEPGAEMIDEGQRSFRSQIAYISLVAVLTVTAVIVAVWSVPGVALGIGAVGVTWTALTLRSGIELTHDGLRVRGMLRSRTLSWADVDAFTLSGFGGAERALLVPTVEYAGGPGLAGFSAEPIQEDGVLPRIPLLSVVAVVTRDGERLPVRGTAATPLDPAFPVEAAAELNRALHRHHAAAAPV